MPRSKPPEMERTPMQPDPLAPPPGWALTERFALHCTPPYRLDLTVSALRRVPANPVDTPTVAVITCEPLSARQASPSVSPLSNQIPVLSTSHFTNLPARPQRRTSNSGSWSVQCWPQQWTSHASTPLPRTCPNWPRSSQGLAGSSLHATHHYGRLCAILSCSSRRASNQPCPPCGAWSPTCPSLSSSASFLLSPLPTPESDLETDPDTLRSLGLSTAKVLYPARCRADVPRRTTHRQ